MDVYAHLAMSDLFGFPRLSESVNFCREVKASASNERDRRLDVVGLALRQSPYRNVDELALENDMVGRLQVEIQGQHEIGRCGYRNQQVSTLQKVTK